MAVSPSTIRGIRRTLSDVRRTLNGADGLDEFLTALDGATDSLDELTDEHGAIREDAGPRLGSRVQRPKDEDDGRGRDVRDPSTGKNEDEPARDRPRFGGRDDQ